MVIVNFVPLFDLLGNWMVVPLQELADRAQADVQTLADRLLEHTGTISPREMREQVLESMRRAE